MKKKIKVEISIKDENHCQTGDEQCVFFGYSSRDIVCKAFLEPKVGRKVQKRLTRLSSDEIGWIRCEQCKSSK